MDDATPDPVLPPEPAGSSLILCPQCGQAVEASLVTGPVVECPHCGTQFFPPTTEVPEDESIAQPDDEDSDAESELSELRIRQLVVLRRSAYRTRTYFIVGALGCFVLATQLVIYCVEHVAKHHHWGLVPTSQALFALAGYWGMVFFGRRVIEVQRGINAELQAREEEEREAAKRVPDLSTLSDGSQHAKNLERMFSDKSDNLKSDRDETVD